MAVSKVIYGSQTLIDLTSDTVTEDTLLMGTTAHDAAGNEIVGTFKEFTKLWENSSPASNFAAQTISLNLSEYQFIAIRYRYSTTTRDAENITLCKVHNDASSVFPVTLDILGSLTVDTQTFFQSRDIKVTKTGITFEAGYHKGSNSTSPASANNAYIIPLEIYGVK